MATYDDVPTNTGSDQITISMQDFRSLQMQGQQPRGPPPPSGLGNPGPLGLAGFAATTFMLSVFNAGVFIDVSLEHSVLPMALFYGGIAQFIAGLYEFKIANTFGATAFCSYGAFWCSFAGYVYFIVPDLEPAHKVNQTTGLFLLIWTIFTLYMMIASFQVSYALLAIFVPLEITFILLTAGNFAGSSRTVHAGGWFGLLTALAAWYASAAVVINSTWGRSVCPIGVRKHPTKG